MGTYNVAWHSAKVLKSICGQKGHLAQWAGALDRYPLQQAVMTEDVLAWLKDRLDGLIVDGMYTCMRACKPHDRCCSLHRDIS